MIELLGVTIAWETLVFIAAFVASEVIGESSLKSHSVFKLIKNVLDEQIAKRGK